MKKLAIVLIGIMMCVALAACGSSSSSSSATSSSSSFSTTSSATGSSTTSSASASSESNSSNGVQATFFRFLKDYLSEGNHVFEFKLYDADGNPFAPSVQVELSVVNSEGEHVYSNTFSVAGNDYEQVGSEYLGRIIIPTSDITVTKKGKGTCIARIYSEGDFDLARLTCNTSDLPVKEIQIYTDKLPIEIKNTRSDGELKIAGKITDLKGLFNSFYGYWEVEVYVDGEITEIPEGESDFSIKVYYSLKDKDGNDAGDSTFDSKIIILDGARTFSDEKLARFKSLEPGETYYLVIEPDKPR